jgi:hypothetical protein
MTTPDLTSDDIVRDCTRAAVLIRRRILRSDDAAEIALPTECRDLAPEIGAHLVADDAHRTAGLVEQLEQRLVYVVGVERYFDTLRHRVVGSDNALEHLRRSSRSGVHREVEHAQVDA